MKIWITSLLFILSVNLLFSQKDTAHIYTFGGENEEQGRDIELTRDSGFVLVGSTSSFGNGNSDIYLVKVDSNIKYEWSTAIGHYQTEFGYAVKQTVTGGYIVCGYTNSLGAGGYDVYLVRLNNKGQKLWEKTYGGADWDFAYDVEVTPDGGFLVIGETHSFGNGDADAYLLKTDLNGNLEWQKTLGGSGKDIARGLIQTRDGNYAFCGENASKNPANEGDVWLVKFDEKGTILLDTTSALKKYDYGNDLIELSKGGFGVIGTSFNLGNSTSDIIVMEFSATGKLNWNFLHGAVFAPNLGTDQGYALQEFPNGNLLIVGNSVLGNGGTNVYTGMISGKDGSYITAPSYGGGKNEDGFDGLFHPKGGAIFFGTTESEGTGYHDIQVIRVDSVDGNKTLVYNEYKDTIISNNAVLGINSEQKSSPTIFPIPFEETFEINGIQNLIEIKCFTSNSKEVKASYTFIESDKIEVDLSLHPSGVYFISIVTKTGTFKEKVLKK